VSTAVFAAERQRHNRAVAMSRCRHVEKSRRQREYGRGCGSGHVLPADDRPDAPDGGHAGRDDRRQT
jgi:hypothetical protein